MGRTQTDVMDFGILSARKSRHDSAANSFKETRGKALGPLHREVLDGEGSLVRGARVMERTQS